MPDSPVITMADPDEDTLRALVTEVPEGPVLSVYARTDPRDPANTNHTPAWLIELRNGLRDAGDRVARSGDHDEQRAFEALRREVEAGMRDLTPAQRARSVAWFLWADGGTSRSFSLRSPVRRDAVVWDARPFVSPLVDVVDRGARTGAILVTLDSVRILHVHGGHVEEPDDSTYELSLGDWRPHEAYASANPARGQQTVSHQEHYEARVDERRGKLFESAAAAAAARAESLGWERVAIVAEGQVASRFRDAMPQGLRERVVATLDHNAGGQDPPAVAAILEPVLDDAWRERTRDLVATARERAAAGAAAAIGAQKVLEALGEGRVEHLIIDPQSDLGASAAPVPASFGGPSELLAERAVEAAISTGARVSALSEGESPELSDAGGVVALLRY